MRAKRWPYVVVVAVCLLPRAAALLYERGSILTSYVEKSDRLAQMFLANGTFGYVPGEPSASTQPLYGWFLIAVYWIGGRNWWSLGAVQILIAICTALLVYEIGRRFISWRAGLAAAVIATLQPYLVWHDIHANREILDQPLGAAMFLLALLAGSRRSLALAAALGFVSGVAILSNSRLALFPLALAAYLFWRHAGWTAALAVPLLAVVALAPWVVRNKVEVGCWSITTDAKALWKANNVNTYATLQAGKWIDEVPGANVGPPTPLSAGDVWLQHHVDLYKATGADRVDECAQQSHYTHLVIQFWEHHPGAKAKLMVQATRMLWTPDVTSEAGGPQPGGVVATMRHVIEPMYMIPLYLLALGGLFVVTLPFRVLALGFLAYSTFAAWIFAGTTRYRVAWDFVLALLAAAALEWLYERWRGRRREPAPDAVAA